MRRTEQQIAADQVLEEAIRVCAMAYGFGADAEFVGDWLLVAELPQIDGSPARYGLYMPGGILPEHRARGLVDVAGEAVDQLFTGADDDEQEA